jgi:plasmid stabilization system protein ParE
VDDASDTFSARGRAGTDRSNHWYEQRAQGLGSEFLRAVEAVIAVIEQYPKQNPIVLGLARRAVLRRFPYSVIYIESESEILVLACFHGRRDPRRLQARVAK